MQIACVGAMTLTPLSALGPTAPWELPASFHSLAEYRSPPLSRSLLKTPRHTHLFLHIVRALRTHQPVRWPPAQTQTMTPNSTPTSTLPAPQVPAHRPPQVHHALHLQYFITSSLLHSTIDLRLHYRLLPPSHLSFAPQGLPRPMHPTPKT